MGIIAHNDWLEIAYCLGLLGISVYVVYWVSLFKLWRIIKKDNSLKMIVGMFIIIFFMRTFFSMSYYMVPEYSCLALGYALATAELKKM
jgi:hypothetical protein